MRIALIATCIGDALFPDVPRATVTLLERLGHEVVFPPGAGVLRADACQHRVPDGGATRSSGTMSTCSPTPTSTSRWRRPGRASGRSDTSRRWWPGGPATRLWPSGRPRCRGTHLRIVRAAGRRAGSTDVGAYYPHRVTYHPTCHSLRMLHVGDKPLSLLRAVDGIDLVELPQADTCCGFGGTFALKNADTSSAMLADKITQCAVHRGRGLLGR